MFILFISIILKAAIGFGNALIFITFVSIYMDTKDAIVLCTFWGVFVSISNLIKFRNYIDFPFAQKSWIPSIPGVIISGILYISFNVEIIRIIFSIFLIFYVINKSRNQRKITFQDELTKGETEFVPLSDLNEIPPSVFYSGYFTYGFIGGLIGASGPINVFLLGARGYKKEAFIANFSATNFPNVIIILVIYLSANLFPVDFFWMWVAGFPLMFLGAKIGYWFVDKISIEKFQILILVILFIMGINMFFQAFNRIIL